MSQKTTDLPHQELGSNGFCPDRPRVPASVSSFLSLLKTGEYAAFDAFVEAGIVTQWSDQ